MVIVGRSDKLVISRVEQIADTAYLPCHFVNIFFRGYACILGVLLYLLTVFIGTGKENTSYPCIRLYLAMASVRTIS